MTLIRRNQMFGGLTTLLFLVIIFLMVTILSSNLFFQISNCFTKAFSTFTSSNIFATDGC